MMRSVYYDGSTGRCKCELATPYTHKLTVYATVRKSY